MRNMHPIYHIKELMIKQELAKDPALADQSWDRACPNSRRKMQRKKPAKIGKGKKDQVFPPRPSRARSTCEIESGEYFLSPRRRREGGRRRSWTSRRRR